jgi:osmotically inducible lipoprotein OsmB
MSAPSAEPQHQCHHDKQENIMKAPMKNTPRPLAAVLLALSLSLSLGACGSNPTRQQVGVATGAVVGGVVGAALTGGSTTGTVAGAAAGGLVGNELSKRR